MVVVKCLWQPPNYNIPETIDWITTLVVGFPSEDKRLAYMQLESLTGWSARDEWAYEAFGMKNHPFMKSVGMGRCCRSNYTRGEKRKEDTDRVSPHCVGLGICHQLC